MSALVDFLTARFAEDQADWYERHTGRCAWTNPCYDPPYEAGPDPALCDCRVKRAMADLASKRATVELHKPVEMQNGGGWFDWECNTCRWTYGANGVLACQTLRLVAVPYAEHPDYRGEWGL